MAKMAMSIIEEILGPAKDIKYNYPVRPVIEHWLWDHGVFYRKGKRTRKCLIGCKGTEVWIFVGSPPTERYKLDLKNPDSIQKIKQIMRI